jgi:hypothetical protein
MVVKPVIGLGQEQMGPDMEPKLVELDLMRR